MAATLVVGNFRPVYGQTLQTSFKINASTAVSEGDAVSFAIATGLITPAPAAAGASTTGIIGIAAKSGAVGEIIPVYMNGVFEGTAKAATDLGIGVPVYLAGEQGTATLDTGDTGEVSIGVVVDIDPASAGKVRFLLTPSTVTATCLLPVTHAAKPAHVVLDSDLAAIFAMCVSAA